MLDLNTRHSVFVSKAKLSPPPLAGNCVDRDLVQEGIRLLKTRKVTVIHSQAGYGKTTLLGQWFEVLSDGKERVAWLSLDEFDQQLEQFAHYLLEACVEAGFFAHQHWPAGGDADQIQRLLLATFASCEGENFLVLDDFHRAASEEVVRCVNYLIEDLPQNFRIIIGARDLPEALVTADLRLHDQLAEVTDADLRFTSDDIQTYFSGLLPSESSASDTARLLERTEGWPAALQMIRRKLEEGGDFDTTMRELTGRSTDLGEYFLEQVFNQLDERQREFLVRTSILERVNGDLGNHLCDRGGGWQVLEELARRDFFVSAVDADRGWFRYHRLFVEFLLQRLRLEDSPVDELHARAARWLREEGHLLEAVQHALRSGQKLLLAELLDSMHGWQYAIMGSIGLVERILSKLDQDAIRRFPRVWLASMYLATRRGRLAEARKQMRELRRRLKTEDQNDLLESEVEVFAAILDRYGDEVNPRQLETLEQLDETLPVGNHLIHAVRCNLLCAFYASSGRYAKCLRAGDQAIAHFRACGSAFGEAFIYFHQGFACLQEARLRDAEALFLEGKSMATEQLAGGDLAAIGNAFHALLCCAADRLAEARGHLDAALHHIERADGWFEVYASAYESALIIAISVEDTWQVDQILKRAIATAHHRQLPRLRQLMEILHKDYAMASDGVSREEARSACGAWFQALEDCPHPLVRRALVRAAARSHMRIGEDREAATLLSSELKRCKPEGHLLASVSFAILLGCAQWRQGQRAAALEAFEFAVSVSVFEGIKRPFVEEREFLSTIMPHLVQAMSSRRTNRLRDGFLAQLRVAIEAKPGTNRRRHDFLSRREKQVLRLLIEGLTYAEMADELCLSVNTIKFHMKNLYGKLGVENRREAIRTASRTRLL